jgi:two-component system NtrC family response regulator
MKSVETAQAVEDKNYNIQGETLEEVEKTTIKKVLEQNLWNRTTSAQSLGISRRALFRKIKRYGLI